MADTQFDSARAGLAFSQGLLDRLRAPQPSPFQTGAIPQTTVSQTTPQAQVPASTPPDAQSPFGMFQNTLSAIPKKAGELFGYMGQGLMQGGQKLMQGLQTAGQAVDTAYGLPGRIVGGLMYPDSQQAIPRTFSEQVGGATAETTGSQALGLGAGLVAGFAEPMGLPGKAGKAAKLAEEAGQAAFQGFPDLSTKLLEKLKGRSTVSRQFIEDLSNSPDLKQAERDLIRRVLDESKIPAFRGGSLRSKEAIESGQFFAPKGEPMWFSKTREVAEKYGEHIAEADMSSFKFLDTSELSGIKTARKIAERAGLDERYSMKDPKFIAQLQKEGYDGLIMGNGNDYAILNPNAQIGKSPTISVPDFANRVKSELLPLDISGRGGMYEKAGDVFSESPRWENVVLPDELRGPVSQYDEHVFESPIKTSAGNRHDFRTDNYFAHTRIEDLPGENLKEYADRMGFTSGGSVMPGAKPGSTRRVIELQSDLFQKGRLEGEALPKMKVLPDVEANYEQLRSRVDALSRRDDLTQEVRQKEISKAKRQMQELLEKANEPETLARQKEIAKLEPYRNTWHERVIREEVKQAAKDGKTKLQFPTGETAMKIEGLGENPNWYDAKYPGNSVRLLADKMKVGMEVNQRGGDSWIITDVLGDGKFKAVPKKSYDEYQKLIEPGGVDRLNETARELGQTNNFYTPERLESDYLGRAETFDISGKVDTNNPIYKFYEKEVGKYLKNKYGATLITDPQGVKWWEVTVKPEMKKAPVEAFGAGAAPLMNQDNEE